MLSVRLRPLPLRPRRLRRWALTLTPLCRAGFACYSVFNVGMYFWPAVREQYAQRHDGSTAPLLRS